MPDLALVGERALDLARRLAKSPAARDRL